MSNQKLLDAFGQIEEEFITEADPEKKKKSIVKRKQWKKWGVVAACAVVAVGISAPFWMSESNSDSVITDSDDKESALEGDIAGAPLAPVGEEAEAEEGTLTTMEHMTEIQIKIDGFLPDGFQGTIEVGTDQFHEGEQITVIFQDNVTVVNKDGGIFEYNDREPNAEESGLEIGSSVWVGFQKYDYAVGNGIYNQIFAYHVDSFRDVSYKYLLTECVFNEIEVLPVVSLPNLREDIRQAKTNSELFEYYGIDLFDMIEKAGRFEEMESSIPKGLYIYADGSCFDMNHFVFSNGEAGYEVNISIGKNTQCIKLLSNDYIAARVSTINEIQMQLYRVTGEANGSFLATLEIGECDLIININNCSEEDFVRVIECITRK